MTTLVWAVVCIVLAAAGAGLGYWFGNRHRAGESAKLEAVQAELDDYRKRVSEHFGETATRFHDLGRQYRELYEHMAAGSQDLCSVDDASGKLPFAPSDRPAIAGGGSTAQDDSGSEAAVRTDREYPGSEGSVEGEYEPPDSDKSMHAEYEPPGSDKPVHAEHEPPDSDKPVQAEQELPDSEESAQSDHERTAAEDPSQAAEETKEPAADEDKQQPGDQTTEQATESEAPRRTYH